MPIQVKRILERCTSCGDDDPRDGSLRISAGYRIGKSRLMQSVHLCNVCILALKKKKSVAGRDGGEDETARVRA